jgi:sugar lactone lactonase YvrE
MTSKSKVGAMVALLVSSVAACAAADAAAPATITIPGERLFTESLTSAKDGTVIVGSVMGRTIFRVKPGAETGEAWIQPGTEGLAGVFGVLADDKSNTLWACSGSFGAPGGPPPPPSALYAFDLKTGAHKAHYAFPTAGGFCNDIAVDKDGNAYATDTNNMQVVQLKKGAKELTVWSAPEAFGAKGGVLDGIAVLGDRVLVNTLMTSKIFATPIGKDGKAGATVEVKLDTPVERPDGMRSFGANSLLVAEGGGGKLSKVVINGDSGKRTVLKEGLTNGLVAVTVVGTTAYGLESGMRMGPPGAGGGPPPKPSAATAVEVGKP